MRFETNKKKKKKKDSEMSFSINEFVSSGETLGAGSFATVYLGHHVDDETHKVAIKVMDVAKLLSDGKDERAFLRLASEIRIQKETNHENIVQLEGVYKDEKNVYLVMELCWGDLTKFLRTHANNGLDESGERVGPALGERHVRKFMQDLAMGLKCLRDHNVMHRDLKPQSMFCCARKKKSFSCILNF
jgi:serine/threonine-protein kinase ULK2